MFRPFQKTDSLFYVGLVFMIFPLGGLIWFNYPIWVLPLTLLFAVAYLLLIHLKDQYKISIAVLWFYLLFYIFSLSLFVEPSMLWFLFFPSNLLVWRFRDGILTYRFISFLTGVFLSVGHNLFFAKKLEVMIMGSLVPVFILAMLYSQHKTRLEEERKEEIHQKNEYINLLSAENERNRIGRDLHDTLGHTFAMMSVKNELALKQMEKGNHAAVVKELEELHQISKESMQDVRSLINNLKYRTINEEISNITGMLELASIHLSVDNQLSNQNLTALMESHITLILRELITNIIKHAKASQCRIHLSKTGAVLIEVEDNGVGFGKLDGTELHSIQERLKLVKGQLEIVSSANPTKIRVRLEEGVSSK